MNDLSILAAANELPDGLCLRTDERDYSFGDIALLVRERLERIDVLDTRPRCVVARADLPSIVEIYALLEAQIPFVLVHPAFTQPERTALFERVAAMDEPLPAECAVVLFTSGTTGCPKAAMLSREGLIASAVSCAANIPLGPGDLWQLSIPPARIGGFSILTRSLFARSAVGLPGKFSPERFVRKLSEQKATLSSIVPTMLAMILERFPDWRPPEHLRALLVGGSAMNMRLRKKASELHIPVITTYAMTETASNFVTTPYADRFKAMDGAGVPNAGVEVREVAGALEVRTPALMLGYWGRDRVRSEDWFATGDMGWIDEDGQVHVRGRSSEMMITGGENVYPSEIEQQIETIPGIRACRIIGMPDDVWGVIVTALLVPQQEPLPEEGLRLALASMLANYKRPRRIAWVRELPVTASGKPDRSADRLKDVDLTVVHYTSIQ
ncbi:MAG: long-chain fatty acid--CoA ligase [Duodenibacillus sp.]|nr:long-chain fatty acid--CoA ligase [Duodenibacillus sp.]HBC68819.1 o-succinylbenzoate--CoA ligase [Sutterella sp.]